VQCVSRAAAGAVATVVIPVCSWVDCHSCWLLKARPASVSHPHTWVATASVEIRNTGEFC